MSTRLFTSPLFVGFDQLEQMLERAAKSSSDGYPPYNIEQLSPTMSAYHTGGGRFRDGRPADHPGRQSTGDSRSAD